jgi:hypothetical protein
VKFYGLRYLAEGGELKEYNCRKNIKSPKQPVSGKDPRGKGLFNLQRHGVILVKDEREDHPRTLKVSLIYGFRDHGSETWHNVFH